MFYSEMSQIVIYIFLTFEIFKKFNSLIHMVFILQCSVKENLI